MFIVFEGIDGSGKTTQADLTAKALCNLGYDVVSTREPGGTDFAEKIRELIFSCENSSLMCEILLFTASRYSHYMELIYPALLKKKIVVCDRFIASTLAYQIPFIKNTEKSSINDNQVLQDSNITTDLIIDLHKLVFKNFYKETNLLVADCTFFLNVPLSVAFKRMKKKDKFESRGKDYYASVINNYQKLAQKVKNYYMINANAKKQEVSMEIMSRLMPVLDSFNLS